jgi:hypothetical protein
MGGAALPTHSEEGHAPGATAYRFQTGGPELVLLECRLATTVLSLSAMRIALNTLALLRRLVGPHAAAYLLNSLILSMTAVAAFVL